MLLSFLKVEGHSMLPLISNRNFLLVSSLPYIITNPNIGDVIVFKASGKFIVKRIMEIKNEKYKVSGDNKNDSKEFGFINREKILGKVIFIL